MSSGPNWALSYAWSEGTQGPGGERPVFFFALYFMRRASDPSTDVEILELYTNGHNE